MIELLTLKAIALHFDPLLRVCGAPHVVHTQRGNNATHPDFQARPPQGISENDF